MPTHSRAYYKRLSCVCLPPIFAQSLLLIGGAVGSRRGKQERKNKATTLTLLINRSSIVNENFLLLLLRSPAPSHRINLPVYVISRKISFDWGWMFSISIDLSFTLYATTQSPVSYVSWYKRHIISKEIYARAEYLIFYHEGEYGGQLE